MPYAPFIFTDRGGHCNKKFFKITTLANMKEILLFMGNIAIRYEQSQKPVIFAICFWHFHFQLNKT